MISTNQTLFVSLNPLVYERHKDKGGLFRKRLDGGAKSTLLQPVIIVFPPMKAGRQRNVISLKSIRPSEEEAAWLDFFFKLLDAHSWASKPIKEGKKRNWSQWEINLLLGSYQGLSSFEDYQAYTFQHHLPLIRSFFPEKFCWKVQTILYPYKTFCSILPNLSIQFGWLNSQYTIS